MKIATVTGSVQPDNNTTRALAIVQDQLRSMQAVTLIEIIPANMSLPLPGQELPTDDSQELRRLVSSADGVILATPEYHGSFSSLMKLAIENLGFPSALAKKPVVLLGVAAGRIGAIKSL